MRICRVLFHHTSEEFCKKVYRSFLPNRKCSIFISGIALVEIYKKQYVVQLIKIYNIAFRSFFYVEM